jgi:multidrug resistance efflux pump
MGMKSAVLLGIVLVAATIFGIKLLTDAPAATTGKDANGKDIDQLPPMIVAWGFFEVEPGIAGLYPRQFGSVKDIARENKQVDKGDVLLQVEDQMAILKARQAAALVNVAEKQLAEAKLLPQLYKLQIEQQQAMVKSIDEEIAHTESEKKRQLELIRSDSPNDPRIKNVTESYRSGIAKLNEKKKSEQAKLKQIQLQDAQLKIDQAEADVDAKKLQHEEGLLAVTYYKIVAPSKGTVLRVHVHQGEVLGPNPRSPAIEFLPDSPYIVRAEVLQEWGRLVKEGQPVDIEDDTYKGLTWKGTVKTISKWYAPTRSPVIEPFRYNDVRTLECIIEVKDSSNARYGQRVRAKIKI